MPRRLRLASLCAAGALVLATFACGRDPVVPAPTLATAAAQPWVAAIFDTTTSTTSLLVQFRLAQGPATNGVSRLTGTGSISRGVAALRTNELLTADTSGSRYTVVNQEGTMKVLFRGVAGSRVDVSCLIRSVYLYQCDGSVVDSGGRAAIVRYEVPRPID